MVLSPGVSLKTLLTKELAKCEVKLSFWSLVSQNSALSKNVEAKSKHVVASGISHRLIVALNTRANRAIKVTCSIRINNA